MDELFSVRTLTGAVNAMKAPIMRVYNRVFKGREHMEPTDSLQFDVISGSEKILKNISIYAPATVSERTGRKTITLKAPRLAQKRFFPAALFSNLRALGMRIALETMKARIARENKDMRNITDRTLEFWAANALKGVIYDSDLATELMNYNVDATHKPVLTGTDLWTDAASDPIDKLRQWKLLIEDDTGASIDSWVAFLGSNVMSALLDHTKVLNMLKYDKGSQMAESGRIKLLVEIELIEHNASFVDNNGTRQRFIDPDEFLLLGICDDAVDTPYAPIVDDDAPGGVGNIDAKGSGVLYFSKSWPEKDPSGKWVKIEARPLPVLQRPGAVIDATPI